MEYITCTCKECAHTWGELVNLWVQIGKGYIGPTILDEDGISKLDIISTGEVRLGEKQTLVDKWYEVCSQPIGHWHKVVDFCVVISKMLLADNVEPILV